MTITVLISERAPQTVLILEHLKEHGSLSPVEAMVVLNVHRLAARIQELRNQLRGTDMDINTEIRKDARGKRYARYTLVNRLTGKTYRA